jgi:probable phosphoglycerate mutase
MDVHDREAESRELIVVRHAEAHCNVAGIVGGPTGCTGLTDLGRIQTGKAGKALASRLNGQRFLLYASPRRRAAETAALIGRELNRHPVVIEDLRDPDCGEVDGRLWADVRARANIEDPALPLLPGGETWQHHVSRVANALILAITAHASETVIIVGHVETVGAAYHLFLGIPADTQLRMKLLMDNAGSTIWSSRIGTPAPTPSRMATRRSQPHTLKSPPIVHCELCPEPSRGLPAATRWPLRRAQGR